MGGNPSKNPSAQVGINPYPDWSPQLRFIDYTQEKVKILVDEDEDGSEFRKYFEKESLATVYELYSCKKTGSHFLVIGTDENLWLLIDKTEYALFVYRSQEKEQLLKTTLKNTERPPSKLVKEGGIREKITLDKLCIFLRSEAKLTYFQANSQAFCKSVIDGIKMNRNNTEAEEDV